MVITPAPRPDPRARLLSIQYLRGLAALMVVLFHACVSQRAMFNPLEGFVAFSRGVDIFFVISGFIMYSAARDEPPLIFVRRRIVRVVPLYWLATMAAILKTWHFRGTTPPPADVVRSLLFIPFDNPTHGGKPWPVLVQGWTLNYEMIFYLLFALALVTRRPATITTLAIVALVGIGSIGGRGGPGFETWTDMIMLEFVAGIWLGKAFARFDFGRLEILLPLGIAALLAGDLVALPRYIEAGIPAVAIVAGALAFENRLVRPWRWAKLIGDASYAIYLSHVLVLFIPGKLFQRMPSGWFQFLGYVAGALLFATFVGLLLHLWIERPLLAWLGRDRRKRVA